MECVATQVIIPLGRAVWTDTGVTVGQNQGVQISVLGVGGWREGNGVTPIPGKPFYAVCYPEGTGAAQPGGGAAPVTQGDAAALGWSANAFAASAPLGGAARTMNDIGLPNNFVAPNAAPFALVGVVRPGYNPPGSGAGAVADGFTVGRDKIFAPGELPVGRLFLCFNDLAGGAYADNYGQFVASIEVVATTGENPIYQRFPSAIIPESAHSPRWMGNRVSASGADARIRRQSRPYWVSDLSNCVCSERLKDTLTAILWRNGGVRPVLNHIPSFCELGEIVGQDFNGEPIVEPVILGVGNGAPKTYQLKKRLLVPGYEAEEFYYTVTKPNHGYPPLEGLGKTLAGPVPFSPLPPLQILADGNPIAWNQIQIDRNTGQFTTSAPGVIGAVGGFYILQLLPAEIPMKGIGNGFYKIESGIRMEEPFGGL